MYTKPSSPQSIGQVLDGSFRLTAMSFRHVWVYALLAGLAGNAAAIYQFTRGGSSMAALAAQQDAVYWSLVLAGSLLGVLFMAAIYLRIDAIASGRTDDGNALSAALPRWPLLVVAFILYFIAVAVGLVLLIIPGIILMVSLMLCTAVLLFEDKGPIASLTGSHRLVWGHWWRTLVIMTVGGIIVAVLYMILGVLGGAIAPVLAGGDALIVGLVTTVLVLALAGILITPFFVALGLNVYWDLKLRKEGGDLAARAQAV